MAKVLFDTDVLIDHLRDPKRKIPSTFTDAAYSSVTRAELYSGSEGDEDIVDRLLDHFQEIPVDRAIAEEAGRIRRITGVRLPDALIAASAIVTKRRLVTRNLRDFKRIKRVRLEKLT